MREANDAMRQALWDMYQENTTQARHHEEQRSTVSSSLIAISGAVIGLIAYQKGVSVWDLPLTVLLVAIGIFGAIFSEKLYERFSFHMERARRYRDALDALLDGSPIKPLKEAADKESARMFPKMTGVRLHSFWLALYLLIVAIGVTLTVIALIHPSSTGEASHAREKTIAISVDLTQP